MKAHPLNATHSGLRAPSPPLFQRLKSAHFTQSAPCTVRPRLLLAYWPYNPLAALAALLFQPFKGLAIRSPPLSRSASFYPFLFSNTTRSSFCFEITLVPRIETVAVSVCYKTLVRRLALELRHLQQHDPPRYARSSLQPGAQHSLAVLLRIAATPSKFVDRTNRHRRHLEFAKDS